MQSLSIHQQLARIIAGTFHTRPITIAVVRSYSRLLKLLEQRGFPDTRAELEAAVAEHLQELQGKMRPKWR